jgi:hypothetical protein
MHMLDGIGRSDVLTPAHFMVDTDEWRAKTSYNDHDGINGVVRIAHTPNHRFCKGTEFLLKAVQKLRSEGLQVELVMAEGLQNKEVRELLPTVDILCEQLLQGMGISAVEGLATGLPTISNFEHECYRTLFRRFSFMDENPVVQASPEDIVDVLRSLVLQPKLRREIGIASRQYAEKYHSFATAQYLFGTIYSKLLKGQKVDLFTLFHPILSPYNNSSPKIQHPLELNRLPDWLMVRRPIPANESKIVEMVAADNDQRLVKAWTAYLSDLDTGEKVASTIYDLFNYSETLQSDWRFWFTIGLGYRLFGNYDHAELMYRKALSIQRLPEIVHELMVVAQLKGALDESTRYLDILKMEYPEWSEPAAIYGSEPRVSAGGTI